ncbi:MAG: TIR domain-containing protein [Anaerolineae bacterium]|nr:TIR domain-containing protein [Anaerolineae bacterium]
MAKVFISYSRKDTDTVRRIREQLEKLGHEIWIDTEAIKGGANWLHEISNNITQADALLVVWSQHAKKSKWVEREITIADNTDKLIIPLSIDGTDVSTHTILVSAQSITGFRETKSGDREPVIDNAVIDQIHAALPVIPVQAASQLVPPQPTPTPKPEPPENGKPRWRLVVGIVAGLVVIALAVGGVIALVGRGDDDSPTNTPSNTPANTPDVLLQEIMTGIPNTQIALTAYAATAAVEISGTPAEEGQPSTPRPTSTPDLVLQGIMTSIPYTQAALTAHAPHPSGTPDRTLEAIQTGLPLTKTACADEAQPTVCTGTPTPE